MFNRKGHKLSRFVGPLEADILEILWRQSPLAAKEIRVQLRLKKKLAPTTVLTVLARLEAKGVLQKTQTGRSFVYTPTEDKATFIKNRIEEILRTLKEEFPEEFKQVSAKQ